ncbi:MULTISPECIES: hypothetical protein [Streptomyces]|uniref:hypothetical protein n=1 Tax=Streptomyces TaxID=1883 RepID=UPI0007C5C222|nr:MULTISPECIES: hypothetical protein [Streptomyces]RPK89351.1 hypothetical protein EES46_15795 [Streptomyces sp. ADI98-10]
MDHAADAAQTRVPELLRMVAVTEKNTRHRLLESARPLQLTADVLARTDSPLVFPGGQPARPISAWAMGERFRELGIRLAEARSTALFQLATELPAAVLARSLGFDITVAVK